MYYASIFKVIRRVAQYKRVGHRVHTILITSLDNFEEELARHFADSQGPPLDAICAFGSMHHAPRVFILREVRILIRYLKPHGKWLQLAYPLNRWTRWQQPDKKGSNINTENFQGLARNSPFSHGWWGGDGKATPWAE